MPVPVNIMNELIVPNPEMNGMIKNMKEHLSRLAVDHKNRDHTSYHESKLKREI